MLKRTVLRPDPILFQRSCHGKAVANMQVANWLPAKLEKADSTGEGQPERTDEI